MLTLSHPSLQIVRGFAGAVLFSFPMLMTMEMWSADGITRTERAATLFFANDPRDGKLTVRAKGSTEP